jgi:nucleotide-binding universal stress UspA family protein
MRFLGSRRSQTTTSESSLSTTVVGLPKSGPVRHCETSCSATRSGCAAAISLATAAARSIAARPWPSGSEVRIVSVVEQIVPAADPWYSAGAVSKRIREDNRKQSGEAVSAAEEIVASAGIKTESAVLEGSPKRRIVEESKAWGADLIVVGSHGRRGLTRYLLGSVSEAVAMHAHCSVEVIRDRTLIASTLS